MSRGRPFQQGNKFGKGRPKGSLNKKTIQAQQLLENCGTAIVDKAIQKAVNGDSPMLRTLLPFILPRPKEQRAPTEPLRIGNLTEITESRQKILDRHAAGQLSTDDANKQLLWLSDARKDIETHEIADRMTAIEEHFRNANPTERRTQELTHPYLGPGN